MTPATAETKPPTDVWTGLYDDIPEAEYHASEGFSQSQAKILLCESPADLKWQLDHPSTPTDAQRLGTLTHMAIIQPELFDSTYAVHEKPNLRTKAGKAEWEEVHKVCDTAGVIVITQDEHDTACRMRDSVRSHPEAGELLAAKGRAEVTMKWVDPVTSVFCRGRLDWLPDSNDFILDIKTTRKSPHPERFASEIATYGYHIQAAAYASGLERITSRVVPFKMIVVNKFGRCAVSVVELDANTLHDAYEQWVSALTTYRVCMLTDKWPGYGSETVSVPDWALGKEEGNGYTGDQEF